MSPKPRLAIIVPYRDRQQHLSLLLPHLHAYFSRDKTDHDIPVRITIVEQPPGFPFNHGLLSNIGYQIVRTECDYVCFHDVDYLPIWADYSYPSNPTMLVWYGIEGIPLDPANPALGMTTFSDLSATFGCVVLFQNKQFERANGYSNDYWGWGYEDTDIVYRLKTTGFTIDHRKGTFSTLLHKHHGATGFDPNTGAWRLTGEARRNEILFQERWKAPSDQFRHEGLNAARFILAARRRLSPPSKARDIVIEHCKVQFLFPLPPSNA
jgi:hypothetical protein